MSHHTFNAGHNHLFSSSATKHELRGIGLYDRSGNSPSSGSSQNTGPSHNFREEDPLETYYRSLPTSDGSFLASDHSGSSGSSQGTDPSQNPRDEDPLETYYRSLPTSDGSFLASDRSPQVSSLYDHSGSSSSSGSSGGTGPSDNLRHQDPLETYYRSLPTSDGSFLASDHSGSSPQVSSRTQSSCDQYPRHTMRLLTESFTPIGDKKYGSAYSSLGR